MTKIFPYLIVLLVGVWVYVLILFAEWLVSTVGIVPVALGFVGIALAVIGNAVRCELHDRAYLRQKQEAGRKQPL